MSLIPAKKSDTPAQAPQPTTTKRGKLPTGYAQEIVLSDQTFRTLQRSNEQVTRGQKRKREARGDASKVFGAGAYKGPWARYEEQDISSSSGEEYEVSISGSDSSQKEVYYEDEIAPVPSKASTLAGTAYKDITAQETESSTFHGAQERDYQGRTYMHIPTDINIDLTSDFESLNLKCYAPKKQIHTFKSPNGKESAHDRAITALRFLPTSGHLLLSASADSELKLWDAYHSRSLLRSFSGHAKSVSDIDFSPDGSKFLSCSYDRSVKVWDTETGDCTGKFKLGSTPHVVRWFPGHTSGGEFIAGMHDNRILQYDTREAASEADKPTQIYDHHLGPINTLTFIDENRRFISTSDDKSLRAWEWGIPVPTKLISDSSMFALTRATGHPIKPAVLCQSGDNVIKVFHTGDRIRVNRKKEFRGHNVAGYAVDVAISPDGGVVTSGDSGGFVCSWDYKTCRMLGKYRVTRGGVPLVAIAWNPRETSKVVTGDGEGFVRYWD